MHQNLLLGLCQPNTAAANNNNMFVQVNQLERQTSTDKIEAALNALIEDGKRTAALKAGKAIEAKPIEDAQVVESEPADAEESD